MCGITQQYNAFVNVHLLPSLAERSVRVMYLGMSGRVTQKLFLRLTRFIYTISIRPHRPTRGSVLLKDDPDQDTRI